MGIIAGKTFKSGNSVAVRLPRELGFGANTAVTLERVRGGVMILPAKDPAEEKRKLDRMIAALLAIGPVGEIGLREPVDIPERPGL